MGVAGTVHGASVWRELELLVDVGLALLEALRCATSAPASVFGLPDRGRIAAELRADFVLLDGDLTTDLAALWDVVGVERSRRRLDKGR